MKTKQQDSEALIKARSALKRLTELDEQNAVPGIKVPQPKDPISVVIVDDQEIARITLEKTIRALKENVDVVMFSNAPEALNFIYDTVPDLVLTDFAMPGEFDGLELLHRMRSSQIMRNIAVIVVTGLDNDATKEAAQDLAVDDYLVKPPDTTQFIFRLKNVFRNIKTAREKDAFYAQLDSLRIMKEYSDKKAVEQAEARSTIAVLESRQAQDVFVGMVSHEFRTPLQSIVTTVETLSNKISKLDIDDPALEKSIQLALRRLCAESDHLMQQAVELAVYVRAESERSVHAPRRVDLPTFLDDVINQHWVNAERKGLVIRPTARQAVVVFDPMRVRQILTNLIGNAVKYTLAGDIHVVLDVTPRLDETQQEIRIVVEDTGPGIDDHLLPLVFEPWERGGVNDGEQKGLGLGLTIVRKLVSSLKGKIELTSKVGKGTKFVVTIPLEEAAQEVVDQTQEPVGTSRFPYSVLMVDDTKSIRESMVDALQDAGAMVSSAASGEEALEMMSKANFDVIFMDLQMATMSGYSTAARIRAMSALKKRPIIVAMSAFTPDESLSIDADGSQLFDCFAAKPISQPKLFEIVRPLLTASVRRQMH